VLNVHAFYWALGGAFIASTVLAFVIAMFTTQIVVKLLEIPYWIYASIIIGVIVWSCMEYTGTVNDLYILALCGALGLACKHFKISRPAVMVAFILIEKLENYTQQTLTLYQPQDLLSRPIFMTLMVIAVGIFVYSLTRPNRGLEYH
jgi:TctA family transporter